MPTVPPEPGPEATYQEYCAYLTDVLGLRQTHQLSSAQAERYLRLQQDAIPAHIRRTLIKDEPDQ